MSCGLTQMDTDFKRFGENQDPLLRENRANDTTTSATEAQRGIGAPGPESESFSREAVKITPYLNPSLREELLVSGQSASICSSMVPLPTASLCSASAAGLVSEASGFPVSPFTTCGNVEVADVVPLFGLREAVRRGLQPPSRVSGLPSPCVERESGNRAMPTARGDGFCRRKGGAPWGGKWRKRSCDDDGFTSKRLWRPGMVYTISHL